MDLKIFFSTIDEAVFSDVVPTNSFAKSIHINAGQMPPYKKADIALIGIEKEKGDSSASDEIRKKLFRLKKGSGHYKIIDLGNLRQGIDEEETYLRIKEVCQHLMENNVLPVIFGGSHDLDYGQFMAYEGLNKLVSVLNIDAMLDMDEDSQQQHEKHIQKIFMHSPNYLFHFSQLGYQTYLCDQNALNVLEKLYFDNYRLGQIRDNIGEMEPVIRNADMLSFDICAIRSGDAPGSAQAQPFGLTGEEACQICWYAGLNDKLSSAGFYGYNPSKDDKDNKTAAVVATMIWYFVEGYYNRRHEKDFRGNDYLKYVVSMPSEPAMISFFKSKISEKWWMEVPHPHERDKFGRNLIVPCSYSDYELATKGEVPDRWIHTQAKLI